MLCGGYADIFLRHIIFAETVPWWRGIRDRFWQKDLRAKKSEFAGFAGNETQGIGQGTLGDG